MILSSQKESLMIVLIYMMTCCNVVFLTLQFMTGPGGDIRSYLQGLAGADSVQKYVEQNPFGQRPITESNPSWDFYKLVMKVVKSLM